MRLQNMVTLVVGAGSGIGRATALLFAREGASVVAADLSAAVHDTTAAIHAVGGRCFAVQDDVSLPKGCTQMVEAALKEFGGLQAVVLAAAVSAAGTVTTMSEAEWHRIIAVDLSSAFYLGKVAVPAMARSGGGSIVLVASQLGLVGARNSVAYTAAKGGIVNMARSMALDHAAQGIRVNCLCPGPIETPFLERSFQRESDPAAARVQTIGKVPLGRIGTAEEIAHGALFLASPEASFVTGTTLVVDGGYLSQ